MEHDDPDPGGGSYQYNVNMEEEEFQSHQSSQDCNELVDMFLKDPRSLARLSDRIKTTSQAANQHRLPIPMGAKPLDCVIAKFAQVKTIAKGEQRNRATSNIFYPESRTQTYHLLVGHQTLSTQHLSTRRDELVRSTNSLIRSA